MREKLLVPEAPLQTLPTLVVKLGLKEALILQQLHYRLLNSPYKRNGHTWYRHTYADWQKQFPFYSERTISRAFLNLEHEHIIISTHEYNPAKNMKTKWYRIDYEKLYHFLDIQYDPISQTIISFKPKIEATFTEDPYFNEDSVLPHEIERQIDTSCNTKDSTISEQFVIHIDDKNMPSIKEEFKEEINKKTIVEKNLDVVAEVINYLNQKTNRNYRINNKSTRRFINARLKDGYKLEDLKKVIDFKVQQWLHNPKMKTFLRPSTLFSPTNFENYVVESQEQPVKRKKHEQKPVELNYTLGEEE